jgi:hypothetical protein
MIDSLKNQYLTYYYQAMNWYGNLDTVAQFFVLFGIFTVTAVIISLYIIKKATG